MLGLWCTGKVGNYPVLQYLTAKVFLKTTFPGTLQAIHSIFVLVEYLTEKLQTAEADYAVHPMWPRLSIPLLFFCPPRLPRLF
jgi:hypothetical protein